MSVMSQMAMVAQRSYTLGDSFDKRFGRRNNLSQELVNATDFIKSQINSKKSNADVKKIETALNNIFYPKGSQNPLINREALQEAMVQENLTIMQEKLANISGAISSNGTADSLISLSDFNKQYFNNENSSGFTLSRIETLKNTIQDKMNKLNKAITSSDKNAILGAIQEIENQETQLKNLLAQYGASKNGLGIYNFNQFNVSQRSNIISILKTIYLLYEAVSNTLTVQDWQVFKRALAETSKYFINGSVDELTQEIRSSLTSKNMVQRGISSNPITYQVSTNVVKKDFKDKKGFTYQAPKSIITFTPNSTKQGKMDVQLKWDEVYGGNEKDYRVRAKLWSRGSNIRGLGTTSVFNAIARSVGQSRVEAYTLATLRTEDQFYKTWGKGLPSTAGLKEAHDLAKLALLADVAMGANQQTSYANLLVLDMGKSIKVYDIADMIQQYLRGKSELFQFNGYNEGTIESTMANIYNQQIRRIGRTQTLVRTNTYFALAFNKLNNMKVTIRI